ncbi:ABC transporter permease [Segeticoccus rhizosphaerae]|uniref:ABC transporter permease n=1 Tax=Segeticoccus rhizosphaerae TaxID=1104777 RepID=UPI001264906D|nr:ABC transporter permease [Segeticoccus rhizosphaerae]
MKRRPDWSSLLTPLPGRWAIGLGVVGVASLLAVWAAVTYSGMVEPFFLPSPTAVGHAFYDLLMNFGFLEDIWASLRRILVGFVLAVVLAVPIGVAMGSMATVQSMLEPILGAARYMPATAFISLLIIWMGIGEAEKSGLIFIGVFFPLCLVIADAASATPRERLNAAYTLGASRARAFWNVLLPSTMPQIIDLLRIAAGWAWTYVVVAELVAADSGIGQVIITSGRFLRTDQVIAAVLTIGVLGLITDLFFRVLYKRLFPYAERVTR